MYLCNQRRIQVGATSAMHPLEIRDIKDMKNSIFDMNLVEKKKKLRPPTLSWLCEL